MRSRRAKGQLRPILVKQMQLAVQVVLYQQEGLFRHFLAVAVDQLDAVVIVRVMAGRDHDAAVKVIHPSDIGHRGRGGDMEQVGIGTAGGQTRHQAVLKHIGAAAGILADHDPGRVGITVLLPKRIVVPPQKTSHFIRMVCCQRYSGFPAEAIGPKIFSHSRVPLSPCVNQNPI